MYSVIVSVAVALVAAALTGLGYGIGAAVVMGVFVWIVTAFLLFRHFMGKLNRLQNEAFKLVEAQKLDMAIKTLKDGFRYNKWMIRMLGEQQLNGNVGMLLYVRKSFDEAFPYLRDSFAKNWMAMVMLAATHYKRKEFDKMEEVLDKASRSNDKVPLVWGTYAWLMDATNKPDKAIEALSRGAEANPSDEAIKSNLLNLQNKKKLKMQKFGDVWYQLHLEPPPQQVIQQYQSYQRFAAQKRR